MSQKKSILADIDMIRGRYVAGKSNTVCPVLKSFFNKNTQLLHLPEVFHLNECIDGRS